MKLIAFRVTTFRSIDDSGWIDTGDVTALIGTNESGKTNLLLALWKLNPASEGDINLLADLPRTRYNELRDADPKPVFIRARFSLDEAEVGRLAGLTNALPEELAMVEVARSYSGYRSFSFPAFERLKGIAKGALVNVLTEAHGEIEVLPPDEKHEALKARILAALEAARASVERTMEEELDREVVDSLRAVALSVKTGNAPRDSAIVERYAQLGHRLDKMVQRLEEGDPGSKPDVRKALVSMMPDLVYYSNYGNLDSEIYLPHVIDNMERDDLGSKEEAKVRTLKVLFEFVGLSPKEIQELGRDDELRRDASGRPRTPTADEIEAVAARKKEREVLLTSASASLTGKFRDWWKQGEYRFRFDADGDHFRIWVSDDQRPEEIELEGRSAGLQWFLSFYLVFLVESGGFHSGSVLLLDEPGHSLHPLAQEDLSAFFDSLAETNQLLYTTHSPFLVDPDHLDRVRSVFVADDGHTAVSANLSAANQRPSRQEGSIYAVHAALGLSAARSWFRHSNVVIVEGESDQIYLSAIKNYLVGQGLIRPRRDFLFIPARGVKGVRTLATIFSAPAEEPPPVLLDADPAGKQMARALKTDGAQYEHYPSRVITVDELRGIDRAEVEDLWPGAELARVVSRALRGPEIDFDERYHPEEAFVPQVVRYAEQYGIALSPGWKVEVAVQAKARLLRDPALVQQESESAKRWLELFQRFEE